MEVNFSPTLTAIRKHGIGRSNLIPILHEIQKEYRYLPEDALRSVADIMDIPLVDVYGVATFFTSFSLEPKGKHTVTTCMGTACHVRKSGGVSRGSQEVPGHRAGADHRGHALLAGDGQLPGSMRHGAHRGHRRKIPRPGHAYQSKEAPATRGRRGKGPGICRR